MIREYIYFVDDNPNGTSGMTEEEIVRCKDCVHYDPPHINDNGKRIEYSDLPQEVFGVAEHIVSIKYGVNVSGRCTVDYYNGYSEDKRVYRKEYDFCSKGKREE